MNLKCFFGFHRWYVYREDDKRCRVCPKCKKYQEGSYDMSYGETIWKTTSFHGLAIKEVKV